MEKPFIQKKTRTEIKNMSEDEYKEYKRLLRNQTMRIYLKAHPEKKQKPKNLTELQRKYYQSEKGKEALRRKYLKKKQKLLDEKNNA